MMRAPNGLRANSANLKCWSPKGMPIMVKHKTIPTPTSSNAKGTPPNISHNTLSNSDPLLRVNSISFPKGAAETLANLKHCCPTGIPTIVIDHNIPKTPQLRKEMNPPKINHAMFPNSSNVLSFLILTYVKRNRTVPVAV